MSKVELSLTGSHQVRHTLDAVRAGEIDLALVVDWDLDRPGDAAGVGTSSPCSTTRCSWRSDAAIRWPAAAGCG